MAQAFPSQPVRIVIGFPPGGSSDILIRPVAEEMRAFLGQSVIVDNKPGAGGIVAIEEVARAKADGHVLFGQNSAGATSMLLAKDKVSFDPEQKLVVVSALAVGPPSILVVAKDVPAKSLAELVAHAKASPGKVRYGSIGVGSSPHLDMLMLARATGTALVHVPQKGGSQIAADLLNGNIHIALLNAGSAAPLIKNGDARPLAVVSARRLKTQPNVPTFAELGFGHVGSQLWHALLAPAGTPPDALDKLYAATQQALKSARVIEHFERTEYMAAEVSSRAESTAWVKTGMDRQRKLIAETAADMK